MADEYMESKLELDRMKKIFRRLHMIKEQEITVCRVGKRVPAGQIREMRKMEATIEAILEKQKLILNTQQRNLFENFKNNYRANMRSWKNRLASAEQQRARRKIVARPPTRQR